MVNQIRFILIIAFLLLWGLLPCYGLLNKVVFIDSYSKDYEKTNLEADIIINQLLGDRVPIDFAVQYLSSEIFQDTTIWKNRMNLYLDQCRHDRPNVIILISDEAWTTFRSCDLSGLDGIPIILASCKSNSLPLGKIQSKNLTLKDYVPTVSLLRQYNAIGDLRELRPEKLFNLMDHLLPNSESYLILTDNQYLGRLNRLIVEDFLKKKRPKSRVTYLTPDDITIDSLCNLLTGLDLRTAVYLFEWNDSKQPVSSRYTQERLMKCTGSPFFINSSEVIVSDAQLAGNYISLEEWGRHTSDLIERVMFGVSIKDIPFEMIYPDRQFVNCESLQRFHIPNSRVPEGTVRINELPSLFSQYKTTTVIILILGLLLLLIIIFLIISNRKMHGLMMREKDGLIALEQKNEDLRTTQEQLVEALDRTKEIDKVKSSFLSNMSHEIRTPLNAIIGFSELLIETDDSSERHEYMNTIMNNNALLLKLVNDVLDISRLDSGRVEFTDTDFSLFELLCELHTNFEALVPQGIDFRLISPPLDCEIRADRSRLYQVISNLLSNACKFTIRGEIELSFEYDELSLSISVRDTGIGIPKEKIEQIFRRFEKINGYDQGVGLGLSLASSISERMGGTIEVESQVLEGSLFRLRLPIERLISTSELIDSPYYSLFPSEEHEEVDTLPRENILKNIDQTVESDNKIRVLYAEDNDSNFLLADRLLADSYQLTRARNGQEAIERFMGGEFQIVLMDLLMPVLGGIEATRKIRAMDSDIPIIALSASVFETDVQEAINAGCNAFLPKPVNALRLKEVIERWIQDEHIDR